MIRDNDWLVSVLRDWGRCVVSEEDPVVGGGYHESSPGADAMSAPIQRTKDEQREVDRLSRVSITRAKRTRIVETEGKQRKVRETIMHMIPRAQPHDTRSRRGSSPKYEPWPVMVRRVHNAMWLLPEEEQQVIVMRYVMGFGVSLGSQRLEISQTKYRETIARAEGAIRGMLSAVAA